MIYTVTGNRFHNAVPLYEGKSLKQAIKVARKYDCKECQCGGPTIEREDGAMLKNWHAAKPFHPANETYWDGF